MRCYCLNISDMVCSCDEKLEQFFCFSHGKAHFMHKNVLFWPNPKNTSKIPELVYKLQEKREKLSACLSKTQEIVVKCYEELQKIFSNTVQNIQNSINDIDQACKILEKSLNTYDTKFLHIHSYLFTDSYSHLNSIF